MPRRRICLVNFVSRAILRALEGPNFSFVCVLAKRLKVYMCDVYEKRSPCVGLETRH